MEIALVVGGVWLLILSIVLCMEMNFSSTKVAELHRNLDHANKMIEIYRERTNKVEKRAEEAFDAAHISTPTVKMLGFDKWHEEPLSKVIPRMAGLLNIEFKYEPSRASQLAITRLEGDKAKK